MKNEIGVIVEYNARQPILDDRRQYKFHVLSCTLHQTLSTHGKCEYMRNAVHEDHNLTDIHLYPLGRGNSVRLTGHRELLNARIGIAIPQIVIPSVGPAVNA